jgi:WD40 repeat protein
VQVLAVRFNCLSERILAVGFANGSTHIYDSRKQRAVMEFSDATSPRRTAGIAWAPNAQTHLVLASDDDRSPTLQFWDLRKHDATQLEYVGHSRGVTDVAWCPHEPGVMVSSGKDQQTIVWDVQSGDRLGCLGAYESGPAIQVCSQHACACARLLTACARLHVFARRALCVCSGPNACACFSNIPQEAEPVLAGRVEPD